MAQAGRSADDDTEVPLLPSSAAGGGGAPRRNRFAFVCATLASMTTILHGYNLTLMSGAQLFMRQDVGLSDAEVEVLAGSMNVFMLASILAAGWVADRLGRRFTLVLANAFLMAGALAMSLGGSFAALMAARFVTSIGAGFARVVAPVYNAEIAPASSRGVLSSLLDIFINFGILLSYVSNYAFAGLPVHLGWRLMYAIGAIPPVFIAGGVCFMPESPRWLAMRGRDACSCAPPTPRRKPTSASRRSSEPLLLLSRSSTPAAASGRSSSCGRRRACDGSSRASSGCSSSCRRPASTPSCSTARWCSSRSAWRRTAPSSAPPWPSEW